MTPMTAGQDETHLAKNPADVSAVPRKDMITCFWIWIWTELFTALVIVRRLEYVNDWLSHGPLEEPAQSPTMVFFKVVDRVLPQQIRYERVACRCTRRSRRRRRGRLRLAWWGYFREPVVMSTASRPDPQCILGASLPVNLWVSCGGRSRSRWTIRRLARDDCRAQRRRIALQGVHGQRGIPARPRTRRQSWVDRQRCSSQVSTALATLPPLKKDPPGSRQRRFWPRTGS